MSKYTANTALENLKDPDGWILLSEYLPDAGRPCEVKTLNGEICRAIRKKQDFIDVGSASNFGQLLYIPDVTHWRFLKDAK